MNSKTTDPEALPRFATIREVARVALSERMLRDLLKAGELPGFYCGNRFYINTGLFFKKLDALSGVGSYSETQDTRMALCPIVNIKDLAAGGAQ